MKVAVAILATGKYEVGAHVLFHTLEKYGKLPDWVDRYALGVDRCEYANPMPIKGDYSKIPISAKYFPRVADKFEALTLPYDRIVLMDADMLCVGDCSLLWSGHIGELGFYACRDTASYIYYPAIIDMIGLDPNRLFNAGTMIFQMERLCEASAHGFVEDVLCEIQSGLRSYDGGDQGYLNAHFQLKYPQGFEIGFLPPEYNESYDVNMPSLPHHAHRIIHFTGPNANPWSPRLPGPKDPRWPWVRKWQKEAKECNR